MHKTIIIYELVSFLYTLLLPSTFVRPAPPTSRRFNFRNARIVRLVNTTVTRPRAFICPRRLPTANDQNVEKPADYRPPVPPHRTQLMNAANDDDEQAPPPPKRHHHHHHHHRNRSQGMRRVSIK